MQQVNGELKQRGVNQLLLIQVNENVNSGIINQEIYMTHFSIWITTKDNILWVKKIPVNTDIILTEILIQTHMSWRQSGRINHAQERYITKLPRRSKPN